VCDSLANRDAVEAADLLQDYCPVSVFRELVPPQFKCVLWHSAKQIA